MVHSGLDPAIVGGAGPRRLLARAGTNAVRALQETAGNRAVVRLVAASQHGRKLARETWWRGAGEGVAPSSPGGAVHDFGDGLYLTNEEAVARRYAALRAGEKTTPQLFKIDLERGALGRVLDLTKDARWTEFMRRPAFPGGPTQRSLIEMANENYWSFFRAFLAENKLTLADFDAVIGPEFVRGATQICIRNPELQAQFRANMVPVPLAGEATAAPARPAVVEPVVAPAEPAVAEPASAKPTSGVGNAIVANGASLALTGILLYMGHLLAKQERENIRRGWKLEVVPHVLRTMQFLEHRWRFKPETRPSRQTYLVVIYSISFEKESGSEWVPGGPVYLYQGMSFLGCYVDTKRTDGRLVPPPDPLERIMEKDVPRRQVFATSIPVAPQRPIRAGGDGHGTPIRAGGDTRRTPIRSGGS